MACPWRRTGMQETKKQPCADRAQTAGTADRIELQNTPWPDRP